VRKITWYDDCYKAAVKTGKHAFIEKPVAVDPLGCRRVINAWTTEVLQYGG